MAKFLIEEQMGSGREKKGMKVNAATNACGSSFDFEAESRASPFFPRVSKLSSSN